ncbi:MAG: SRPBCC family protein [Flexistipes sinusarabici]|uniref:SRPBCC family protein n=1 Tax=Flexistipes sinusarabici TaxID=2352 RepID=A0A5D0MI26_FLESI|nr:SRPBCC family protein [Flexistipes sinusarabici]TYB33364.1 MAG: SRPBCC family protein [Flexistipes sinusarabici]
MPRIYQSGVINAEIDEVWDVVRDFNSLSKWHPGISISELENGTGVGCIRHLFFKDGGELREKLLGLSDINYSCTYCIVESPMPVKNYVADFALFKITDTDKTFMHWYAYFDVTEAGREEETAETVKMVFNSGIKSLQEMFG